MSLAQLNDLQFTRLGEAGYTGSLPDRMRQFEDDNAIDSWDDYLAGQGYTAGQMNTRKMEFWTDYTPPP